jgi:hypothetical protein
LFAATFDNRVHKFLQSSLRLLIRVSPPKGGEVGNIILKYTHSPQLLRRGWAIIHTFVLNVKRFMTFLVMENCYFMKLSNPFTSKIKTVRGQYLKIFRYYSVHVWQ